MKKEKIFLSAVLVSAAFCLSSCGTAPASVPTVSVPDVSVPDASVPDASVPDASVQDASVPDASGSGKTKSVVISDLHLGIDDSFAENVRNKPLLIGFLQKLQEEKDIKELIIAGDFLDEWYLPLSYPAYSDSDSFYRRVIENNRDVIDEFANVMKKGIRLVYVPGNHDMLLSSGVLDEALPGIIQARDADGLGVYYTGFSKNAAVEHGHRYDVFSAPDMYSNQGLCGKEGTMLPPGYFYARYAASWVTEGYPKNAVTLPRIENVPDPSDTDQYNAYLYYYVLSQEFSRMTPNETFSEKALKMDINGFHDSYSVEDLFPVLSKDGTISAPVLFRNFQRTWEERQKNNRVEIPASFAESVKGALGGAFLAGQARTQYLENSSRKIDVVVCGHTHIPQYLKLDNGKEYINSGTWVDRNTSCADGTSRTFAVIDSSEKSTTASLFQYGEDGSIKDIHEEMIRQNN